MPRTGDDGNQHGDQQPREVVHGGFTVTGDTPLETLSVHIVDKGQTAVRGAEKVAGKTLYLARVLGGAFVFKYRASASFLSSPR